MSDFLLVKDVNETAITILTDRGARAVEQLLPMPVNVGDVGFIRNANVGTFIKTIVAAGLSVTRRTPDKRGT